MSQGANFSLTNKLEAWTHKNNKKYIFLFSKKKKQRKKNMYTFSEIDSNCKQVASLSIQITMLLSTSHYVYIPNDFIFSWMSEHKDLPRFESSLILVLRSNISGSKLTFSSAISRFFCIKMFFSCFNTLTLEYKCQCYKNS